MGLVQPWLASAWHLSPAPADLEMSLLLRGSSNLDTNPWAQLQPRVTSVEGQYQAVHSAVLEVESLSRCSASRLGTLGWAASVCPRWALAPPGPPLPPPASPVPHQRSLELLKAIS